LLLENPEMPSAAREDLQIILQETQRTKEIVQDLLSLHGSGQRRKSPVNVNAVLRQTIKLRSYDFSSHGVEVSEDFEANLSPTLGTRSSYSRCSEHPEQRLRRDSRVRESRADPDSHAASGRRY